MNKKWLTTGIVFGIGAVMLVVSGYSAMANTSGYDVYKDALRNTKSVASVTANVQLAVTDNGTKLFGAEAVAKLSREPNAGSLTATLDDNARTQSLNVFRQDGKVIVKSGESEVYRVMEHNGPPWQHEGVMPNPPKAVEQVFDALMGNMRELATVDGQSDGSKQASLHLSGSQIPSAVNALGTLFLSNAGNSDRWESRKGEHADKGAIDPTDKLKVNVPKLTDAIRIEEIKLDAKINPDNRIERQTAEIHITGSDESGNHHVLVIQLQADFSDFNQTASDRIDLTGKVTLDMAATQTKRGWHH